MRTITAWHFEAAKPVHRASVRVTSGEPISGRSTIGVHLNAGAGRGGHVFLEAGEVCELIEALALALRGKA